MNLSKYSLLRYQIIGTTLAFSLVPLLLLSLVIYVQFSASFEARVTSNLESTVEYKKRAVDIFIEEKLAQIQLLAAAKRFDELCDETVLARLFNNLQTHGRSYIDLGVIDEAGRHVAYVGPYGLKDKNYKDAPWFHETMVRGTYISDVFLGFRNIPHIIVAVLRHEGERTWILRATLDMNTLESLVQSGQFDASMDSFLVNSAMVLQTPSRYLGPPLTEVKLPEQNGWAGVRVLTEDRDGRSVLLGMDRLQNIGWTLVVSEDPRQEMIPLVRTQHNTLLVTLFGGAVIIVGTLLITRHICRTVQSSDLEAARIEANMMQSNKMAALGKLAAGVAHEVNNPLTLIRESAGWAKDLLEEENAGGMKNYGEIAQALDKIDQHVERARGVTHRLLGFGRRMEPVQDHVNLNSLVEQTLSFLENEALHRNITLVKQLDPEMVEITTDTAQMQQVILNIVDNALDSIGGDGTITVCTGRLPKAREVFVSIEDTGGGIPEDLQKKIFDPFFTTKKVGDGTGLGLSIVHSILQKLGGRIEVESEMGKGSTFHIYLPMGEAHPA
ncbi:MAG: ATP-binding protein [Desulfovibrionaceae bacterium]